MVPRTEQQAFEEIQRVLSNSPSATKGQKEIIALKVMCKLWLHEAKVSNKNDEYKIASKLIDILVSRNLLK